MGIKGIYNEIGPGDRIALSKLAVETFEKKGRPLRIAIDISIWLFQIQSGKGGTNPALRTFYYRLLRLISLSIHPLFVFDGPNKPPFKRNKRTGANVASIPEFLAKQLLKQFGLPSHRAPGEAEAECAMLQQKGIVDAVLSEDVDTLMFGSGLTLRNWSPEGTLKSKVPTHVNLYDAQKTKAGAGLDREGMILVALMSGGDYVPEGIPGCGPKTACQAARAGFGKDLCQLESDDDAGLAVWKERLKYELRTNESKFFTTKHGKLTIPDDFPRRDILRYYTHPCLSSDSRLNKLEESLLWDEDIDIAALRTFTGEAFDWVCISGAKKFIRNLAPALLVKELRLRAESGVQSSDDTFVIAQEESRLIKSIHSTRNHVTTDGNLELRVGFVPIHLVNLDLDAEEPDPELREDDPDTDEDEVIAANDVDGNGEPTSPKKKRGPSTYDPNNLEKIWVLESFVRVGVPLKVQDWEEAHRDAKKFECLKAMGKRVEKAHGASKKPTKGGMQKGALDRFTKVTKPGVRPSRSPSRGKTPDANVPSQPGPSQSPPRNKIFEVDLTSQPGARRSRKSPQAEDVVSPPKAVSAELTIPPASKSLFKAPRALPPPPPKKSLPSVIEIISSPKPQRSKRVLRRSHSDTTTVTIAAHATTPRINPLLQSPNACEPHLLPIPELSPNVTQRRQRSPLRRTQTISDTTTAIFTRPTTPPPSSRTTFQRPPSPRKPAHSQNTQTRTPTKPPSQSTAKQQQPATPTSASKREKAPPPSSHIINISSSPPATPTPHRRQKSITEWLSPSPRKLGPATSSSSQFAKPPPPSFILTTRIPEPRPCSDQHDEAAGVENENENPGLVFRKPRPLAVASFAAVNMNRTNTNTSKSQVIRLRESLEGAWRVEDVDGFGVEGSANANANGDAEASKRWEEREIELGRKRKREGLERRWRVSQVEVLDLTGD